MLLECNQIKLVLNFKSYNLRVMKKTLFIIAIGCILFSCKQTVKNVSVAAVQFDSSYKTAAFADADRKEKIKLAYAVIDSIYKKHAEENHFPAIAFGLVVDGELLHLLLLCSALLL